MWEKFIFKTSVYNRLVQRIFELNSINPLFAFFKANKCGFYDVHIEMHFFGGGERKQLWMFLTLISFPLKQIK